MNFKKMNFVALVCLLFMNNFSMLGSDNKKINRREIQKEDDCTPCYLIGMTLAAISVATALLLYNDGKYTESVCNCVNQDRDLYCLDCLDAIEHPRSKQLIKDIKECSVGKGVRFNRGISDFYADYLHYYELCPEGYFASFQEAGKACQDTVDQADRECFAEIMRSKCDALKKG